MLSMELQLGLALPVHNSTSLNMVKGLDLNDRRTLEPNDVSYGCRGSKSHGAKSKRSLEEAFGINKIGDDEANYLPNLLVWDGQPNEEDDRKGHKKRDTYYINQNESSDEESYVVGWPPIKSSRKKELLIQQNHIGGQMIKKRLKYNSSSSSSLSAASKHNSMYVKVKMEGVAIARKIDLSLHHSYQTLKNTLFTMFTNYDEKCNEGNKSYTLAYQDKEGDWLLAGDVPWQSFIKSVQRLEMVRINGG
ncbi:AUX/IAA protein [Trema orientale]|uniref:Auxin-responsive protein n=1 Tax=Trema orientale TaxID=63057 RepID=A0A2P5E784_TREOI|nr:AUX/IAA protein [Trema orientale]